MLTRWEYSTKSEASRVAHTAHRIADGFFKTNNFLVLPYGTKVQGINIAPFPEFPYNKISRFWEKVKRVDVKKIPLDIDPELLNELIKYVKNSNFPKPNFENIKKTWQKAEMEVLETIYKVLPHKKNLIKKIVIYPTCFGTSASFYWTPNLSEIWIYLREDRGIHEIAESIITALTRDDIYKNLEGLWNESEIITDFLVTHTSISKVLEKYEAPENYIATMKGVRIKQQAKLLQESAEFYKKLGLPTFEKPFSQNGLIPELFGKPVENLSIQERRVLLTLIKNANQVTSIEDISLAMFENEDNFSLYAIAKLIQRLRTKLEINGISGSYIQTLRGKGYLLKN